MVITRNDVRNKNQIFQRMVSIFFRPFIVVKISKYDLKKNKKAPKISGLLFFALKKNYFTSSAAASTSLAASCVASPAASTPSAAASRVASAASSVAVAAASTASLAASTAASAASVASSAAASTFSSVVVFCSQAMLVKDKATTANKANPFTNTFFITKFFNGFYLFQKYISFVSVSLKMRCNHLVNYFTIYKTLLFKDLKPKKLNKIYEIELFNLLKNDVTKRFYVSNSASSPDITEWQGQVIVNI